MSNTSLGSILQANLGVDKLNFTRNTNFNIMQPNRHILEMDKLNYKNKINKHRLTKKKNNNHVLSNKGIIEVERGDSQGHA